MGLGRPRPSWQLKLRHQLGCVGVERPSCDVRPNRAWALPGTLELGEGLCPQGPRGALELGGPQPPGSLTRGGEDAGGEEQG